MYIPSCAVYPTAHSCTVWLRCEVRGLDEIDTTQEEQRSESPKASRACDSLVPQPNLNPAHQPLPPWPPEWCHELVIGIVHTEEKLDDGTVAVFDLIVDTGLG